jgi:hypothetical protein
VTDPEREWTAEHDGYRRLRPGAGHRRTVRLDPAESAIKITDVIEGAGHDVRLAFHLGPEVEADISGAEARLAWSAPSGAGQARMVLPGELRWSLHRGDESPILGWYSPNLGQRIPSVSLVGQGSLENDVRITTRIIFSKNDIENPVEVIT